jgi:tetratricopeptide (TPR) repeat protein
MRFGSRFVKAGEPSVKIDGPAAAQPDQLRDYVRKVRTLQAKARTKSSLLPTIEQQNPSLAKALLLLALQDSADHHRLVAAEYRRAGVLDFAFRHFQRAVSLERCDAAAYDGLARIWRDWGMPALALGDAYRALNCNPRSPSVYNTLGTVMQALGQTANAREAYARAVLLDEHAAFAWNNLCYLELEQGNAGRAEQFCESAILADPDLAPARNNLAVALARRGDVGRAEDLLESNPTASSHYNLGMLRLDSGRYAEAAEAFDAAAAAKPSLTIARRRAVQARRAAIAMEHSDDNR